jgi:Protein of unknown function (DUF1592)/Protein of unknown function (DUF1588)/Protein of unknown function (DUF1595)/Protein of unknown function (DUF1587)/Protein of unknown function (DUF1585)
MQRKQSDRSQFDPGFVGSLRTTLATTLLLASCTGSVSGSGDSDRGDGGGGGNNGGEGGSAQIDDVIPPTTEACADKGASAGPTNWRRLTTVQYKNTIKDLLGIDVDASLFLSDTTTGRFITNVGQPTPDAQILKYQDTASKVAAEAVRDIPKLMNCNTGDTEEACTTSFFNDFGSRVLRRPVTDEDRKLFDTVYRVGKQESHATGIRLTLEAMLQMPSFLYLVETAGTPSDGVAAFDPYEIASRLSYVLWNTMPDAELTKKAHDGMLNRPDGLRAAANRMMSSPKFANTLFSFHDQLLGIEKFSTTGGIVRDVKRFPEWTDALKTAMRTETRMFVSSVFTEGEGSLKELLTAPYGFPTGPLVSLYGAGQPAADGKVMFPDGSRMGILTQAATLTAASPTDTPYRAILRGKFIREEIFCETLPSPPGNVVFQTPPGADKMTQQELLRVHQEDPTCKGCHELMDPLGFGLESYDGIGRFREATEDGQAVDTSGNVVGTDVEGAFSNTADMIGKISNSANVRGCFARQWFQFVIGHEAESADACSLAKSRDVLARDGGDLREALTLLITSDSFRYRGGL